MHIRPEFGDKPIDFMDKPAKNVNAKLQSIWEEKSTKPQIRTIE